MLCFKHLQPLWHSRATAEAQKGSERDLHWTNTALQCFKLTLQAQGKNTHEIMFYKKQICFEQKLIGDAKALSRLAIICDFTRLV